MLLCPFFKCWGIFRSCEFFIFPWLIIQSSFEVLSRRWVGQGEHLTMMLKPLGDARRIGAIAFNFVGDVPDQGARLTLAYQLGVNDYHGAARLQLLVDYLAMD